MPPAFDLAKDGGTLTVRIPLTFRKRGGRKLVIAPNGSESWAPPRLRVDNTIVKAIARAFRWRKLLETGTHATVAEIAAAEKINASYVGRVLRRGDSGWAAAGADDPGGADAADCRGVEEAVADGLSPEMMPNSHRSAPLRSPRLRAAISSFSSALARIRWFAILSPYTTTKRCSAILRGNCWPSARFDQSPCRVFAPADPTTPPPLPQSGNAFQTGRTRRYPDHLQGRGVLASGTIPYDPPRSRPGP